MPDNPCGSGCQGPLEREALNLLTVRLERQVAALHARGIRALMVDLTNNPGGSNWVAPAARMLTRKRLMEPRQGYIRHPHWARQFSERLHTIRQDAQGVGSKHQPLMQRAREVYERALGAARQTCGRSTVWTGRTPDCRLSATDGPLYGSGVLPYAAPGSLPKNISCCYLFGAHRFKYREGFYSGKLLVLVDREAASAAEYFAAILQDNRAATIVGERTYGAGCGLTNGGISTVLRHSRGKLILPDCFRLRADGSNEVEGVTPDLLVPWRGNDSELQKARRLEAALSSAVRR
jgi:hypothetical protein